MGELKNVTTYGAILGAVIANLRTAKQLKQSDMAAAVGVGPSTWSRLEKGESPLTVDQLRLASTALGESPSKIIDLAEVAVNEMVRKGVIIDSSGEYDIFRSGAAIGATVGITAGSVIPVVGTVLGAVIGAVLGSYMENLKGK